MQRNNVDDYDVIILGGGPVGIALGIELGMQNIHTLILEKHDQPLRTPRAQSLSARTMEFFLRWGCDKNLEDRRLLTDLPQTGVWCSSLCGEVFFVSQWGDNKLAANSSPKEGVRIPLWITEDVLRERLRDFSSVDFRKNHEVQDTYLLDDRIIVQSFDKKTKTTKTQQATYLACCDGATGLSREKFNNAYSKLSDETKMLTVIFTTTDIMAKKTVPDSIMYFVMSDDAMAFFGPINLREDLWLALIVWDTESGLPDDATVSTIIDKIVGTKIDKVILERSFWKMQVQVADFFSLDNRIFWLGDAAHAFAPTGGLGLNTGFGDAQNLGWKLAAVINQHMPAKLLSTYELERRPVCFENLQFAKQNQEGFVAIKKKYPPTEDFQAFALAYAELGNKFLSSSGLTMGYSYVDSALTQTSKKIREKTSPFQYTPQAEPGYFLPHAIHNDMPIYKMLSSLKWNLIICEADKASLNQEAIQARLQLSDINIIKVKQNLYPHSYLLVRPDWHIARTGDNLASILSPIFVGQ